MSGARGEARLVLADGEVFEGEHQSRLATGTAHRGVPRSPPLVRALSALIEVSPAPGRSGGR